MIDYTRHLTDSSLAVFLLHGVVEQCERPVRNYRRKHIAKDDFAQFLSSLCAEGSPVDMDRVHLWCAGEVDLPPRAFAITFDDGFENNLTVAAPVLAEFEVPATIYVTTRFIDANEISWTDRLEHAMESTVRDAFRLPWTPEPSGLTTHADRRAAMELVRDRVKTDATIDVETLVADVCGQLATADIRTGHDELDRKLTWAQVRELHRAEGFLIGGHSHTHPILSFLDPDALACELDTSLDRLRTKAGVETVHYSYPEGQAHCYSPEVIAALKARGIGLCPTAIEGVNPPGTDPFHLRRINVT